MPVGAANRINHRINYARATSQIRHIITVVESPTSSVSHSNTTT
jgi:hypothetical protein